MGTWTIYATWVPCGPTNETVETRPDWVAARRYAMSLACLRGVRYVSVHDPDDVVVGEYDRYTNRWREYALPTPATPCLPIRPSTPDQIGDPRCSP